MIQTLRQSPGRALSALLPTLMVFGLVACGSDDKESSAPQSDRSKTAETAFLTGMVHHHESAIAMAEIAREKGRSDFVIGLAEDIASTQEREITDMKSIYERLVGGELKPDPAAHEGLGLSAEQAGMTHDEETNEMLRAARPFDRAFVDDMHPHHAGAVRMAEAVLEQTRDGELRKLAETIISTQRREIEEMEAFRRKQYGSPVPAGGGHGGGAAAPHGGREEHG